MTFVSLSYHERAPIDSPEAWFERIKMYTGSWELIAMKEKVVRIEHIRFEGNDTHHGIQYCFRKGKKGKLYFPWSLHRFVRSLKPDIVTVHGLHYPLQTILLKFQLPSSVKIIAQHHAEKPFSGIRKYWQQWAGRFIDAYLFASRKMGEDWVRLGNIGSGQKIYEVMEVSSRFRPMSKSLARSKTGVHGDPVFLWVGRLDRNKDPLTVVRAFLKYCEYQPAARLYMIYQTNDLQTELESILSADRLGQVQLTGFVPHAEMNFWYSSADFMISGSHYEGSGTAVCEAMSCGCIPILTTIDSFDTITDSFKCGLGYRAGDDQDLLDKLIQAGQLDKQQAGAMAIARFQQALSFEAIAGKIQTIASCLTGTGP